MTISRRDIGNIYREVEKAIGMNAGANSGTWQLDGIWETGTPANRSRQYPSCPSKTAPDNHCRCHTAKSAYCTGNTGNSRPAYNASNSRRRMGKSRIRLLPQPLYRTL